jgi:selenoprotein W-related protein
LAAKLLTSLKRKIASLELEPSTGGCFELSLDGKLIYSKLDTGRFPNEDQLLASVQQRLGK